MLQPSPRPLALNFILEYIFETWRLPGNKAAWFQRVALVAKKKKILHKWKSRSPPNVCSWLIDVAALTVNKYLAFLRKGITKKFKAIGADLLEVSD